MDIQYKNQMRNWVFIIQYPDNSWDWVEYIGTAGDAMEIEDHLKFGIGVEREWRFGTPDSHPESWWYLHTGQRVVYSPYNGRAYRAHIDRQPESK